MPAKRLLCPDRLRRVPTHFSWIDQRLVRDGHIRRCNAHALALYLMLVTVADSRGLSYYGDPSITRSLSMSQGQLESANTGTAESAVRLVSVMRQFEMLQKAITLGAEMNRKAIEEVAKV